MFAWTRRPSVFMLLFCSGGLVLAAAACQAPPPAAPAGPPHVVGGTPVEIGKYLVTVGQCNDCHTDGFMQTDGNVPESAWLLGSSVGWRGPWGTTYPPNLRLTVQDLTEDAFVTLLKTRKTLPPMPWPNVNQMAESDMRALYQYIRSLGPAGQKAPAAVPPDQEPVTPYLVLSPVMPKAGGEKKP